MGTNPYEALFAQHRSAAVPNLWPWQSEVLAAYAGVNGDAAVELPTGTGKTLIGLLAGENFRQGGGGPVAFSPGTNSARSRLSVKRVISGSRSCASRGRRTGGRHATCVSSTTGRRSA
jgi:hypothetical protein